MLTVVTGPPCAGKSTYIRQHAMPDDIVIDFDQIAQALGSQVTHGHSPHIAAVAAEARHAAIKEAIGQHQAGRRVWIADTSPGERRRWQYRNAGARIITCTAEPAELHRRASENRPASWHAAIDQWMAESSNTASYHAESEARPATTW
jgi:predicted transcriptional regulator